MGYQNLLKFDRSNAQVVTVCVHINCPGRGIGDFVHFSLKI